jgi:hypothetical protein
MFPFSCGSRWWCFYQCACMFAGSKYCGVIRFRMSWVCTFYLICLLERGILTHSRAPIADGSSLWRRFDKWGDGRKRPFGWQGQLPTPYVDFFLCDVVLPGVDFGFLLFRSRADHFDQDSCHDPFSIVGKMVFCFNCMPHPSCSKSEWVAFFAVSFVVRALSNLWLQIKVGLP